MRDLEKENELLRAQLLEDAKALGAIRTIIALHDRLGHVVASSENPAAVIEDLEKNFPWWKGN